MHPARAPMPVPGTGDTHLVTRHAATGSGEGPAHLVPMAPAEPMAAAMPAQRAVRGASPSAGGRTGRLAGLAAAVAAGLTVALNDPSRSAIFPPCPSRTLLGLDCPACGGLRGTHDLLGGRVGEALGHNLLLPGLLLAMAAGLVLWLVPLIGRPAPPWRVPRWVTGAAIAVITAFTVARNLPVDALSFLASDG